MNTERMPAKICKFVETILYYCGLEHIADRSTKSLLATEILLIPNASNLAISLTLKTKAVTKCDSIRLEKILRKREKC